MQERVPIWVGGHSAKSLRRALELGDGWMPFGLPAGALGEMLAGVDVPDGFEVVEDELTLTRMVAAYGSLVDAGEADAVAGLWAEDGEYDVEGWHMPSRDDVRAMVLSDDHQRLIQGGCLHFRGPART